MTTPTARDERARRTVAELRRFLFTLTAVLLALLVYTLAQSYTGRVALVDSQRAGCARGKADRNANALGWRFAQGAREATAADPAQSPAARSSARHVAVAYRRIAEGLEARSHIDCKRAYPYPSLLP